ncbi:unnamed protein product [Caenorhabditis angaria]|uniref:C2H2-type domain-containing protein n=1 Tax=Caenorhabditis angaria TaxID=860376 RepID=A0A9P1I570_9PELO|nr:unnamed protein product [Caenorhabditis angaria]
MMNCENLVASLAQLDMSTLLSNFVVSSSSSSPPTIDDDNLNNNNMNGANGGGCRRKRKRGEVANPSNTLDALVAKKADEQPFEKRYLSEQEAIEGPDDEIEMKRMELDPDVSTRTCSTCGYQGKWVSEMIRHKRVHTSERPFKCRYCSRTSKWKADLIRHVAKTHGIRVVSKYSRSKVFDTVNTTPLSSPTQSISEKRTMLYRCQLCSFEDERVSILNQHVSLIHSTSPCVCRCGSKFEDVQHALNHPSGPNCEMIFNIIPTYEKPSPLSPCHSESSLDSGINISDPEDDSFQSSNPLVSPIVPDIQSTLLNIQSSPLFSLYLALLQSTTVTSPIQVPPLNTVICSTDDNIIVDV